MSPGGTESAPMKKPRLRGACDICRQRKIKCDASKMPGNRCSRCIAYGAQCTHFRMSKNSFGSMGRVIPAHVLKTLSTDDAAILMSPLLDDVLSSTYQPPTNQLLLHETMSSLAQYARVLESALGIERPTSSSPSEPDLRQPSQSDSPDTSLDDAVKKEEDDVAALSERFRRNIMLDSLTIVKSALDLNLRAPELDMEDLVKNKRPQYWTRRPWEIQREDVHKPYVFPEPHLLRDLVEEYFANSNIMLPLLHRPTFERSLRNGFHFVNDDFGGCVLAVCAIGSLYSRDPRVLLEGSGSEQSCGFKYFCQLRLVKDTFLRTPSLYDLQMHVLAAIFLRGSSDKMEKCWYIIGVSLRIAQGMGFHRKQKNGPEKITVEGELRKRVFFCLLLCEQFIGIVLGRLPMIMSADYDVDYPVECDDEFWENDDPELAFKQPASRPSTTTFFNQMLDLFAIYDDAQEAFFSVRKPSPPKGVALEDWNERCLKKLDSALNKWVNAIPEHLRWNPGAPHSVFFDQSAALLSGFYWVQTLIHRPFIASKINTPLCFASMAICTNAARAYIRTMDIQSKKGILLPYSGIGLYLSGVILLVNMWRGRQAGIILDEQGERDIVYKCVKILRTYDRGWHWPGRFSDILCSLLASDGNPDIQVSKPPADTPTTENGGMTTASAFPMYVSELSRWPYQMPPPPPSATNTLATENPIATFTQDYTTHSDQVPTSNQMTLNSYQASSPFNIPGLQVNDPTYTVPDTSTSMIFDQMDAVAGVPMDFDWSQWGTYLANVEALGQTNNLQPESASDPGGFGFY
ncbi:fungal-specific transcription factor domain-containing protein [Ephemerocybe angulata]|uniref:Fungal-specific transcription factor domain-containing protein n=1 Tax=Ephemerocybe angulata TaxID=980116 RepID=A0A8H6I6M8_9AGAR|nr:fungal-specific transcription factor domain-containing protein [Tulosesus angulatus]